MRIEELEAVRAEAGLPSPALKVPFFTVSLFKLAVMTFFTFGLYEVYWFYKNWQAVRDREYSNINATLRAVFALFFCYQLFVKVRTFSVAVKTTSSIDAGTLATGWIVMGLIGILPDPYALLSLFSFLFLLPVQTVINEINRTCAPDHEANDRFSGANWTWIAIGSVFTVLIIVASHLPRH